MKMFLAGVFIIALIIILAYFSSSLPVTREGTLSNVTELYSYFRTYMKDHVNYHLMAIDCEPKEYYYNKSICFICNGYDACFDYGLVSKRGEGYLMNPNGNYYLTGDYTVEDETSFNSLGFSKALGCGIEGEITNCIEGVTLRFEGQKIIFSFPENVDKTKEIEAVFGEMGLNCTFSDYINIDAIIFSCNVIGGVIEGNEVIM